MSIIQKLYDSEINVSIASFWDAGFEVRLGDDMNGFKDQTSVKTFAEAEAWLRDAAIRHYPNSDFAKSQISATAGA